MKITGPYSQKKVKGETFTQVSMTIPDQTLSMRQLINKFVQGQPLPLVEGATYNEEEYFPNLQAMDFTDQAEYLHKVKENVKELKQRKTQHFTKKYKPKDPE